MAGKGPVLTCCVCGEKLRKPRKGRILFPTYNSLTVKQQTHYFCNRHSNEEIQTAITGVPRFRRASEI